MTTISPCPEHGQLQKLIDGQLPESDVVDVCRHLDSCSKCVAILHQSMPSETLLSYVKASPTVVNTTPLEAIEKVVERVLAQPPQPPVATVHSETVIFAVPSSERVEADPNAEIVACLSPAQGPDEIGRLNEYRIREILGKGGMGAVLRADDPKLDRTVAIKIMLPEVARKPNMRERFLREARAAAAIEHDHIVTVHDVNEANGIPFIVMPLLKGESLAARLKRMPNPMGEVELGRISTQIAAGLAKAHESGMVHRDIKPENIWLESGTDRVKLLDFGLARKDDDMNISNSHTLLGTPYYMSPEQAGGKVIDGRSDLFSLGVVMYRLATGELPFRGNTAISVLHALANETPKAPIVKNPKLSPVINDLIVRLLAKDPARRPDSATEVIDTLRLNAVMSQPPARTPWWPIVLAAGLVLAAIIYGISVLTFETKNGKLIVEVDDSVDLRFKHGKLEIYDTDGKLKYTLTASDRNQTLPAGQYRVAVVGAEGVKLETTEFEMAKGGTRTLRVTAEPITSAAKVAGASEALTTTFPGKVVFRDTFDQPDKCLLPMGDPPFRREIINGVYVMHGTAMKEAENRFIEVPARVMTGALSFRVKLEDTRMTLTWRSRNNQKTAQWLTLNILNGRYFVQFTRQDKVNDAWGERVVKAIAKSETLDPVLTHGKWIEVSLQWRNDSYEVWLNGRSVANGNLEVIESLKNGPPSVFQLGLFSERGGSSKLDVDHFTIWDQNGIDPKNAGPTFAERK